MEGTYESISSGGLPAHLKDLLIIWLCFRFGYGYYWSMVVV